MLILIQTPSQHRTYTETYSALASDSEDADGFGDILTSAPVALGSNQQHTYTAVQHERSWNIYNVVQLID